MEKLFQKITGERINSIYLQDVANNNYNLVNVILNIGNNQIMKKFIDK